MKKQCLNYHDRMPLRSDLEMIRTRRAKRNLKIKIESEGIMTRQPFRSFQSWWPSQLLVAAQLALQR